MSSRRLVRRQGRRRGELYVYSRLHRGLLRKYVLLQCDALTRLYTSPRYKHSDNCYEMAILFWTKIEVFTCTRTRTSNTQIHTSTYLFVSRTHACTHSFTRAHAYFVITISQLLAQLGFVCLRESRINNRK